MPHEHGAWALIAMSERSDPVWHNQRSQQKSSLVWRTTGAQEHTHAHTRTHTLAPSPELLMRTVPEAHKDQTCMNVLCPESSSTPRKVWRTLDQWCPPLQLHFGQLISP
eukprot:1160382-Pelagomonas_calceolata.AAC.10